MKGYEAALNQLDDCPSEYEVCSDECSECLRESQNSSKTSKVYEVEPELLEMVQNQNEVEKDELTLDQIMLQANRPKLNKSNAFSRPSTSLQDLKEEINKERKLNSNRQSLTKSNANNKENVPSARSSMSGGNKKRKLIVDYSRKSLTLEQLVPKSASKKRSFA